MKGKIDLQSHTTSSDGELKPQQIVDMAIKRDIKALAITDHDTVEGVAPAIKFAKGKDIEIVPGVEIGCDAAEHGFKKVDILGLFIDYKNKALTSLTNTIKEKRIEQKRGMIKKLNNLGFDITFEEVIKNVEGSLGRPHIAKVLLKKYPKEFKSINDVFRLYIGENKPAYVNQRERITMENAINAIKKADGISVLAHPGVFKKEDSIKLIDIFVDLGGEGIETYYPYYIIIPELKIDKKGNRKMIDFYRNITKSKNLLESGGNDHHGKWRDTLGKLNIPYEVLENLRDRIPVK